MDMCIKSNMELGKYDYHVIQKHKIKYVPFKSVDEFIDAQSKHGTLLKQNNSNKMYRSCIDCRCHVTLINIYTCSSYEGNFEYILKNFHFEDGTPCGKKIEYYKDL